jgi:NADPH2:quinone reductase
VKAAVIYENGDPGVPEYACIHPMIGEMLEGVASGELHVEIDRSFPLSEAAAAHEYAESRKAFGRVILTP